MCFSYTFMLLKGLADVEKRNKVINKAVMLLDVIDG